jgi:hypothetical protein
MGIRAAICMAMAPVVLTGCLGGTETSTLKLYDTAGKLTTELTGAAVQRDWIYMQPHLARAKAKKASYKDSGFNMEMEMVKLSPTLSALLPKKITFRPELEFKQDLETRPPDHRGWNTADKVIDAVTFGLGAYFLTDYGKHSLDTAQTQYHGPYKSYNPTTTTTTEIPYAPPMEVTAE